MNGEGGGACVGERDRQLERYRLLVETAGDSMYILDAVGNIEMANDTMAEYLGIPRERLVGSHVSEFMPEKDVRKGTEVLLDLAADPDRQWDTYEMDVLSTDGERIRCENRVAALTDDDGQLTGSVGVIRVVTERTRERDRLRELTDKVERLHGVATELQGATDPETVYELAIEAGYDILGFDWCVVALAKEGWLELAAVSEDAPVSVGERHLRVDEGLAGAAFQSGEPRLSGDGQTDERGEPVHESFRASVVVPLGEFGVFQANSAKVGYFDGQDVEVAELLAAHVRGALDRIEREQVLRERETELERQNERLEAFASVISHDLRNPLNIATGNLDIALQELDGAAAGDDVETHLGEVDRALDRMGRIIEDVLTLARDGQAPEDTRAVAVVDAVEDAWATSVDDDAEIVVPADPGVVEADRDRLVRLLENLFRNAVEHAGAEPRVAVGPLEDGFFVADDGPGIPPGDREAVFEQGYTTADDGTGFGLAIVQEIAEAHGWAVSVAGSEADDANGGRAQTDARGACFEITGVDFVES